MIDLRNAVRLTMALGMAALLALSCAYGKSPVTPSATYDDFQEVAFDPFPGMSFQGRPVELSEEELQGRILWNLWSGDNSGFWNWLVKNGYGTADLLKMVASPRADRFATYGIFNQPGYERPAEPDRFGLYLDQPKSAEYDFDRRIDLETYGRSSGVMGLRLFPNPNFDEAKWDAERYWNDPNYYTRGDLERPYMVGMTCSFCHTGPDPVNPPADPAEPGYANLSDYVGQHYMKVWEVFGHELPEDNFVKQLLRTNPPGTLDTSFIATDYLNNPGTMNGIYEIPGRLSVAQPEVVAGGALDLRNLDLDAQNREVTPRVLKEGADSVGINAALSRVFLNIGEYWEEWIRHFNPLTGVTKQTPIRVGDAQAHSPHWNWSERHSPALAAYFIRVTRPHKLADAPGGERYLTASAAELQRGRRVFAQNCARCHSSKRPPAGVDPRLRGGPGVVRGGGGRDDFLDGNFLGSEARYPMTVIKTNATRAVARTGWRPRLGQLLVRDLQEAAGRRRHPGVGPVHRQRQAVAGARGRARLLPAAVADQRLGSAPFFHNNALGKHVAGVSVDERMEAFDDAITKLLWPERRDGAGSIWRTHQESWLQVPESYIDGPLARLLRKDMRVDPDTGARYFAFGPIPAGTPVNLVANTDLELNGAGKARRLARFAVSTVKVLKKIKNEELTGDAATQELMKLVPDLYALNACPDLIEDEGHYFGTDLPDADKRALIEFLKTM